MVASMLWETASSSSGFTEQMTMEIMTLLPGRPVRRKQTTNTVQRSAIHSA